MDDNKFMAGAVKHPGGLHRALHVPVGEKIPEARIEAATHSENQHLRKMANLAQTFAKFAHHRPHHIDNVAHKRHPPLRRMAHKHIP